MIKVMDGIINEVNKARKIFTVLVVLSIIPIAGITMSIVVFDIDHKTESLHGRPDTVFLDILFVGVLIIVIGFAIRQLIVLNKWTANTNNSRKSKKKLIRNWMS